MKLWFLLDQFSPWFEEHTLLTSFNFSFLIWKALWNKTHTISRSKQWNSAWGVFNVKPFHLRACIIQVIIWSESIFCVFCRDCLLMMNDRCCTGSRLPVCCNIDLYTAGVRLGAQVFFGPNIFSFSALKGPFRLLCAENTISVLPWLA